MEYTILFNSLKKYITLNYEINEYIAPYYLDINEILGIMDLSKIQHPYSIFKIIFEQISNTQIACYIGNNDIYCLYAEISLNNIPHIKHIYQHNCYSFIKRDCGYKFYIKILFFVLHKKFRYTGSITLIDESIINEVPTQIRLLRDEGSIYESCGFRYIDKNDKIINMIKNFKLPYLNQTIGYYIKNYFKKTDLYNEDTKLLIIYINNLVIEPLNIDKIIRELNKESIKMQYVPGYTPIHMDMYNRFINKIRMIYNNENNNKNKNNNKNNKNNKNNNDKRNYIEIVNINIREYLNVDKEKIIKEEYEKFAIKTDNKYEYIFMPIIMNIKERKFKFILDTDMICDDISKVKINCNLIQQNKV